MKITIDTDELKKLKADADKIVLEPEAEAVLTRILELEGQIAEIKDNAKAKLLEEGKKLNPDFKSWEADTVRVSMRAFGAKYYVSDSEFDLAPKDLFKTEAVVVVPNEPLNDIKDDIEAIEGYSIATTKTKDGAEKLKITRTVDTKAVDKWEKQHRGLPAGIIQVGERPVSLSFSIKNSTGEEADNE